MSSPETYCVDIFTGNRDEYEALVEFLNDPDVVSMLQITGTEEGQWNGLSSVRVLTAKAHALEEYVIKNFPNGDGLSYDFFYTGKVADKSVFWKPVHSKHNDAGRKILALSKA